MDGDHVVATVFSDRDLTQVELDRMARRISHSYGLGEDISGFLALSDTVPVMRAPLALLRGMRQSCPENIFEIAIISLLLQNATIGRTRQMLDNLLHHHGRMVTFDTVELGTFFTPSEIVDVDEKTHRDVNRLGYRAKYIPRFATFFLGREGLLSADAELLDQFQQIKGVGPYTRAIVASHASRDPSALGLDVWNRKILAQRLLGVDDAEPVAVMAACTALFPGYEGLAALYLLEHEYSSHPAAPLIVDRMPNDA
jgi:3-methyladenine DNA glycosylase/8-oxoguanine DNA glycosylase